MNDFDWPNIVNHIPFLGLIANGATSKTTPFSTRMVEAGLIALITGGFSMYVTIPQVEMQVKHVNEQVERNAMDTQKAIDVVSKQVEKIDAKVDRVDMKVDHVDDKVDAQADKARENMVILRRDVR
jgi:outer membrane murein-binding lipoprotein Lpp